MKAQDLKPGQKFYTIDDEGTIRNFTITRVTDSRITVANDAGYAHKIIVRTRYCHAFGIKQAQKSLDLGYWKLK